MKLKTCLFLLSLASTSFAATSLDGLWDCVLIKHQDGVGYKFETELEISGDTELYTRHGMASLVDAALRTHNIMKIYESGKLSFDGSNLITSAIKVSSELIHKDLLDLKETMEAESNEQLAIESLSTLVKFNQDEFVTESNVDQFAKAIERCVRKGQE
jgi:hypothetical protein